jgi:hypothetical protein
MASVTWITREAVPGPRGYGLVQEEHARRQRRGFPCGEFGGIPTTRRYCCCRQVDSNLCCDRHFRALGHRIYRAHNLIGREVMQHVPKARQHA